jgi:two-component system chemotaxis response regulator CheB
MNASVARSARVLLVDDSAFARKVLRETLTNHEGIEVVGYARDGLEALERISELNPDVITLDLMMPNLDGLGLMRELVAISCRARVVVVSSTHEDSELVAEALQLGAVAVVKKPTALATEAMYAVAGPLLSAVAAAARAVVHPLPEVVHAANTEPLLEAMTSDLELLVLGTSTGGPQALTLLTAELPANLPVPIAIALHIPEEYTDALAKRLNRESALEVVEAYDGIALVPGRVVLGRGGRHLKVERTPSGLIGRLSREPRDATYFPSVDVLFETAAKATQGKLLGVVLTGMGDDGLLGSRALVDAGGRVIVEAESSSVIYGMPRVVREAGLAVEQVPLPKMTRTIVEQLSRRSRSD